MFPMSLKAGSLSLHIVLQYCSQGLDLSICERNGIIMLGCYADRAHKP